MMGHYKRGDFVKVEVRDEAVARAKGFGFSWMIPMMNGGWSSGSWTTSQSSTRTCGLEWNWR